MQTVQVDNVSWERTWVYQARVVHVAGAFNWRVQAGDMVHVAEYEHGQNGLAAEHTDEELSWSRSSPVADDQIRTWFKLARPAQAKAAAKGPLSQSDIAWRALLWILGLNFIPLIFNFFGTTLWMVLGILALFLPALLFKSKK